MNQPFAAPSVDLALPLLTICGVMTNLPESHADALATPEARENGVTIVMDGCPSLLTLIATRETYGRLDVDRFSHPRESYLARPQRDGDAYVLRVLSTAEEAQIRAFFGQTATRLPRALRAIAADLGDDTHPLHGILRQPAALTATLLADVMERLEEALGVPFGAVGFRQEGLFLAGYHDVLARTLRGDTAEALTREEEARLMKSTSAALNELSTLLWTLEKTQATKPIFRSGFVVHAPV